MFRMGLLCLLATAVIAGALSCNSSEPGQEPAQETVKVSTAARPLPTGSCLGIHLGDHNLFLLEDYSGGTYVGGKVAAGGNISMSDFSVGSDLPSDNASDTVVAGGDLTLVEGGFPGNAWYGGSYTHRNLSCEPNCPVAQGTPIDFAARFAELISLSSRLATQQPNGTTLLHWGIVDMSGTDPGLNVFEVNASDLTGGEWWNLAAPAGSFVVINIRGTPFTMPGDIGSLSSLDSKRVLYNFVDATLITVSNFGLRGTMLAPHARVTMQNGGWTGGIYAVSLSSTGVSLDDSPLDEMAGGSEEKCNGVDDNCDGRIDEGFECTGTGSRSCTAWCGEAGTQSCDPATCGYGECVSASCCRADADCGSGSYCKGNTCVAKSEKGAACSSASQCASGQCVDGVCCDTACEGECNACNLAGHVGTCSLRPSDAAGTCGTGNSCWIGGNYYAAGTTNPSAECQVCDPSVSTSSWSAKASGAACSSDGNACTSDVCNGAGACGHPQVAAGTSCGAGLVCDETGACVGVNSSSETFFLDSYETANDGAAGPAFGSLTLEPGRLYRVTVRGTYSVWSNWMPACGTSEPSPIYPSPGIANGYVATDAEVWFAEPPSFYCSTVPFLPRTNDAFELSLNGGATWSHIPPATSSLEKHEYTYMVTGQGSPLEARIRDNPTTDNYGMLKVTVELP